MPAHQQAPLHRPTRAPEPLEAQLPLWTTAPDTDDCRAYVRTEAPHFSRFTSQAECEAWVSRRKCRPGFSCYDGCNTRSCDETGMKLVTTLKDCRIELAVTAEFRYASTELTGFSPPELQTIVDVLHRALAAPERKVVLVGHADASEARSDVARERLALARARVVRERLAAAGIPAARLVLEAPKGGQPTPSKPKQPPGVSFRLDPAYPTPGDFGFAAPDSPGWCGSAPTGASPPSEHY